jgi:pimeloyl-ACP methyl ester carboxylesterase
MNDAAPYYRTIDGLRIRYAVGGASSGPSILFTSPWPESILAFRAVWAKLGDAARLVAVDLPGFGRSEGRADLFDPRAMGDFMLRVVRAFELEQPHAVTPDIGTSAALFAAHADKTAFSSLTVGGGGMDELQLAGTLKEIVEAPNTTALKGADGADIVSAAVVGGLKSPPSDEEIQDYRESYAGDRFVKSAAYVRTYPRVLPVLRALLPTIRTPVQVLYGRHDPLVPPGNAAVLENGLPRVSVVPLESGHFAWQDAATEYSAAIRRWVDGGFRAV